MNLEAIPRTFWHSLSLCFLIMTVGLTSIAYKAENFSVKYNEIELLSNGNQTLKTQLNQQAENISRQTEILNQRQAEIEHLRILSENRLNELKEAQVLIAELKSEILRASANSPNDQIERKVKVIDQTIERELKKNSEINDSIATIRTLGLILKQQQEVQDQQQQQILQQQEIQQQIKEKIQSKY